MHMSGLERLRDALRGLAHAASDVARLVEELVGGLEGVRIREEGEHVVVEVDVPGVPREAIRIYMPDDGSYIRVVAEHGDRRYAKRIHLPARVDPGSASAEYRDGVVVIRARRRVGEVEIRLA